MKDDPKKYNFPELEEVILTKEQDLTFHAEYTAIKTRYEMMEEYNAALLKPGGVTEEDKLIYARELEEVTSEIPPEVFEDIEFYEGMNLTAYFRRRLAAFNKKK